MQIIKKSIILKSVIKKSAQAAIVFSLSLLWWGIVYPNYSFVEDTYNVVYVEDEEVLSAQEEYDQLINADKSQIRIKSKLWEYVRKK